ncbi:MAG TPA: ATP-binding protein [Gemmatimonadaceae bacterium]|nr:ATP-binding protein [Gemmatimonadaceae bacterium]
MGDSAIVRSTEDFLASSDAGPVARALFDQSPFSTVVYDAEGHPLAVNDAFEALWGVSLDTVPAGYSVLHDPELEKQGVLAEIRRAFQGETVITSPLRYNISKISATGKGRTLWTQGHFFPVRNQDGKVTHVILKHIDLTAQMTIEQELRASEERLRLATLSAGIGTWDYDVIHDSLIWDERCKRAYGLSADAPANDEVFHRVLHPSDRARVDAAIADAMKPENGGMYDIEYRTLGDDGILRWVHASGRVIFETIDGSLKPARFIGTIADVSERIALLQAERKARSEAEQARQRAEEANKAKSDFLAKMSHELRTPLNAIAGHAELIELGVHGSVTPEQAAALDRIRRNERHLLALINDILDFSKLEAGAVRLDIQDVNVNELVASIEPLVGALFTAKGVEYTVGKCDDELVASGDAERIIQILVNLLSNALKATAEGGKVSITCDSDAEVIAIRVEDTGVGIPEERLESVFSPFTQLGRALNSPHTGVGLGLAISRELARVMGGDVTVSSTVGAGSIFTLTLPAKR